jgi:Arc/MetJ family transcription regulator
MLVFFHSHVYIISYLYTLPEGKMRTNIVINDELMQEALKLSGYKTKKETVEEGLKLLIALRTQAKIRKYRGKLKWEGDLDKMRAEK